MKETYDEMWARAAAAIRSGNIVPDPHIGDPNDSRRGLTLILRPGPGVVEAFGRFMNVASDLEPGQHYYRPEEIHTTVLAILTCQRGLGLDDIDVPAYAETVRNCLDRIKPFDLSFKGLTASTECVMAQGFPEGGEIRKLRDSLRDAFERAAFRSSIDRRYRIHTAHSTLIRFRERLTDSERFFRLLDEHRNADWGTCRVATMALVFNDWYHSAGLTRKIGDFELRG